MGLRILKLLVPVNLVNRAVGKVDATWMTRSRETETGELPAAKNFDMTWFDC